MSSDVLIEGHLPVSALLRIARGENAPSHAAGCEVCTRKIRMLTLGAGELRGLQSALSTRRSGAPRMPSAVNHVAAAERIGKEILTAAAADSIEVDLVTRAYVGDPSLPAGILNALQGASPLVARRPSLAGEFAEFIVKDWLRFPSSKPGVFRNAIRYEALLLLSQVRLMEGRAAEAEKLARGRVESKEDGIPDVARARALYFHASALSALGKTSRAIALLEEARNEFEDLEMPSWVGKAEASIGLAISSDANDPAALDHFDRAIEFLDPMLDAHNIASILLAKGSLLGNLGRRGGAREAYGKGLEVAIAGGFSAHAIGFQVNLLGIAVEEGRHEEVLKRGYQVLEKAEQEGLETDAWYCRLFIAEAYASAGNLGAMHRFVELMLRTVPTEIGNTSEIEKLLRPIPEADREVLDGFKRLRAFLDASTTGEKRAAG